MTAPVPASETNVALEERKLALEERKLESEIAARKLELEIKRRESDWFSRFFSPVTTTLLAGILALAASISAALLQGSNTLQLEREKFISTKNLETQKQQHELVLKKISVADRAQAQANLQFLADSSLIDPVLAEKIRASAPKTNPLIPPPQAGAAQQLTRIDIAYDLPTDPAHNAIYESLRKRNVLEELALFMAPLTLPRKLILKTSNCQSDDVQYEPASSTVALCYHLLAAIERAGSKELPQGLTHAQATAGSMVHLLIRGMSSALIDLLQVPLLGPVNDATDALTQFIVSQFGPEVAVMTIKATAHLVSADSKGQAGNEGSSIRRAINARRLENYLCIAYGADRRAFEDFVQRKILSATRAEGCAEEFERVKLAFARTIAPHIDVELAKRVRSRRW